MSTLVPNRPEPSVVHATGLRTTGIRSSSPALWHLPVLLVFWIGIFVFSLAAPPLLDDADATHAQAAQAMLRTGDWVTLHVDGVRYLEKAPLPYWIAALSLRAFGENAFAVHLPLALAVLGLAALGYRWARRSFDRPTALYTALFVLTSVGPFLFTRIFLPDALLSLLLACGLYGLHRALEISSVRNAGEDDSVRRLEQSGAPAPDARAFVLLQHAAWRPIVYALLFWLAMALAVLTKGLIALIFLLGTTALYLTVTSTWNRWRVLRPLSGSLLFLAVAAPWHVLAGLRNTEGGGGHGFFWFYFVNEHVLRFLGRRIPRDYNKLPTLLYWGLHLVWLFPWSLFALAAAVLLWRKRRNLLAAETPSQRTFLLLTCFSALVLIFFSLSTNQEYYTYPVYLPLLMLLAAAVRRVQANSSLPLDGSLSEAENLHSSGPSGQTQEWEAPGANCDEGTLRALRLSYAAILAAGLLVSAALLYALWQARGLPFVPDIGTVLDRRGIGSYTLSLSHFFDLTGASFAALRLPSILAVAALSAGPCTAWLLHRRHRDQAAVFAVATASGVFLIAAHLALCRFAPMLSSSNFADTILRLEATGRIAPATQVFLFGDQAFGSSLPFYLHRRVELVDGRSSSMLFGSTFPDVPPVFVSSAELAATWGQGSRKLLFVPAEQREAADRLLAGRSFLLSQSSGKELLTDRPLDRPAR